jgi:hypothetical protein
MPRFTLSDLIDKENLIAWLNQDGNPPTVSVMVHVPGSSRYGPHGKIETQPVTDLDTLGLWWSGYRSSLATAFLKPADNRHKAQTHGQFIAWCLGEVGIRSGGTVAERVQRAVAARPDLYTDAATVKARNEADAAQRRPEWEAKLAEGRVKDEADRAALRAAEEAHENAPVASAPRSLVTQELANRAKRKADAGAPTRQSLAGLKAWATRRARQSA